MQGTWLVRGTAGGSADGHEGKEREGMATGMWDPTGPVPHCQKEKYGNHGL